MKLVKSLLLGSAAGFVAMTGAQAADLPSRKAAPAEYVRVCSQYGAGFFYIPGTDTCIQIGGRARYEMQWYDGAVNSNLDFNNPPPPGALGSPRAASKLGHRTLGNIRLDARTPTPWGTLRTFVRLEMARRTGILRSGSAERWGLAVETNDATSPAGQGRAQTQVYLDSAFIQWAGITAGRAPSFFEFACGGVLFNGVAGSCLGSTNLLAYTATFGPGFSATISVEDGVERNGHVVANFALPAGSPGYAAAVGAFGAQPGGGINGSRAPDIVGNFRVDQPWGSAIIAGAAHLIAPTSQNFAILGLPADSAWGWAIMGGLKINLPMLAPGDALFLEATYADGAMMYIDSAPVGFGVRLNGLKSSNAYFTGDAIVDGGNGRIAKAKGYGLLASFLHYWRPDLRSGFSVGYTKHNNPVLTNGPVGDYSLLAIGANLIWSPVRAFDIGLEGVYYRINGDSCAVTLASCGGVGGFGAGPGPSPDRTSDNAFLVRLRLQRDF